MVATFAQPRQDAGEFEITLQNHVLLTHHTNRGEDPGGENFSVVIMQDAQSKVHFVAQTRTGNFSRFVGGRIGIIFPHPQ